MDGKSRRTGCKDNSNLKDMQPRSLKEITISIGLEGYDNIKGQLNDIEYQLDRIIAKQKQIGEVYYNSDRELLKRIDTDCGRIVRHLGCKR